MPETPLPEIPFVADEVSAVRSFLAYYRATLRRQAEGLSAAQLRQALPPSTMTLGGMLSHLAFVEDYWCSHVLHGTEPAEPWAGIDWRADPDRDWHRAADQGPEELLAQYDAALVVADAAIDRALADGGLDTLAVTPRHGSAASLRWILLHLVEEYARHAGHADLIRESIDGATGL
ncbi:DinB superfamily protein [Nocardioides dokdonensis FR1436]|uniref:DinB superfamily protein n=1 Tax=Nocardioides dokdonensis FR1436 TaxID=1300347 RepID=A0A1A9GJK9_9ACTN|nr:DinB family protein [Nocardioides dokdonensis]ANH38444.1 DinB superfamily protein [Nocardioides dokdonensis FR1436]